MTECVKVYLGHIIHCPEKFKLDCLENGFVAVKGKQVIIQVW